MFTTCHWDFPYLKIQKLLGFLVSKFLGFKISIIQLKIFIDGSSGLFGACLFLTNHNAGFQHYETSKKLFSKVIGEVS